MKQIEICAYMNQGGPCWGRVLAVTHTKAGIKRAIPCCEAHQYYCLTEPRYRERPHAR